ncbi:hypothetical protein AB1Y20_001263 [Prymnesium parvum]|uniref:Uncharacterized protein n=1 Tax=Prymnesium parvum TaxID=97485 RepID=A0AB34K7N3_PRYPA
MWKDVPAAQSTHPDEVNSNQALLTVAWHVLARGGELAPEVTAERWSPTLHPARGDVEFHRSKTHGPYAVLWLRPLKKHSKLGATKVPQYIAQHDGRGGDAYMMLRRLFELDAVPSEQAASTPLFRRRSSARKGAASVHMTVPMMRALARGRWASDVAKIYNRQTRQALLEASSMMYGPA